MLGKSAVQDKSQRHSIEEKCTFSLKLPHQFQQARSMWYFIVIVLLSFPVIVLAFIIPGPQACMEVQECAQLYSDDRNNEKWISQCCAAALITLLIREVAALVFTHMEERDVHMAKLGLPRAGFSSGLLCACLLFLSITEVVLATSHAYDHAVPPVKSFRHEWGSVQTLRYGEWLVNVPLLLLLAGHVVLGRPVSEVLPVVAITNLYVVLSWASLVVTSAVLRWLLIVLVFGLYIWTAYDMAKWVRRYLRVVPARLPGKHGRVLLLAWLNFYFAVYGAIFLLDVFGWIGARTGHAMYEICDCTAKTSISLLLANLRSLERRDAMKVLVAVHSRMARASLSVLRSSFDYLIPCTLDDFGNCIVLKGPNADVNAIGSLVGKSLAGTKFTDILYSQRDRDLFDSHMQTGLHQEEDDLAADVRLYQERASRGAPFWASNSLPYSSISLASAFNYDISCALANAAGQRHIPVSIHLSSAVGMSTERDSGPQMIIALRIIAEKEIVANDDFSASSSWVSPVTSRQRSSGSSSSRSGWRQKRHLPGEVRSVSSSKSSHKSAKLIRTYAISDIPPDHVGLLSSASQPDPLADPSESLLSSGALQESFFAPQCFSECSKESLFDYTVGESTLYLTEEAETTVDCATQTSTVQLEESSTQTSIIGSDAGFRCTCCARPPALPQTRGRSSTNGFHRNSYGSHNSSRSASPVSPMSVNVSVDVARSSTDPCNMSPDESSSSSTSAAAGGFDGFWILANMRQTTAAFMRTLRIKGWKVTDAEGIVSYLRQDPRTGKITYEGGVVFLQDEYLVRVGKSGNQYCYKRGSDSD